MMRHIDVDWAEPTFWEKFRLLFFSLLALLIMSVLGAVFIGADGIMRMIGLKDDAFKSTLKVLVEPENVRLYLDHVETENPLASGISWARGTEHVIETEHPSYITEKVIIRIPLQPDGSPEIVKSSDSVTVTQAPETLTLVFKLRPEFIKMTIRSKPTGALIEINGTSTNKKTPLDYEFKTGETFKIVAAKEGYEPISRDFEVPFFVADDSITLELKKKQKTTQLPPKKETPSNAKQQVTGKLQVKSNYPVDVYSGSKRIIQNKASAIATLNVGNHSIRIVNSRYLLNDTQTISIKKNETSTITIESPGKMVLNSQPAGARVIIENREIGVTPGTFEVAPGLYNVGFQWDNCPDSQSQWIKVVSSQTRRIPTVRGCQ
jgi:hypothetical protein